MDKKSFTETDIHTNLLFFTMGAPTTHVRYYEHAYVLVDLKQLVLDIAVKGRPTPRVASLQRSEMFIASQKPNSQSSVGAA